MPRCEVPQLRSFLTFARTACARMAQRNPSLWESMVAQIARPPSSNSAGSHKSFWMPLSLTYSSSTRPQYRSCGRFRRTNKAKKHVGERLAIGIAARSLANMPHLMRRYASSGSADATRSTSRAGRGRSLPPSRASTDVCSTENNVRPWTGPRPATGSLAGFAFWPQRRSKTRRNIPKPFPLRH